MYEVELKFSVPDHAPIIAALAARGANPGTPVAQCDAYFNHPQRDFAQTDEAFRIRTVDGRRVAVTYKGPVVDTATKTRREIELEFAEGDETEARLNEMLRLLSFRPARHVQKLRTPYHLVIDGRDFEVALDAVDDLGSFVEIETLASEADREGARDAICALAEAFGLSHPERRSYLRLLVEQDARRESEVSQG